MTTTEHDGITIGQLWQACARNWYVILAAVLLGIGGAMLIDRLTPTVFTTTITHNIYQAEGFPHDLSDTMAGQFSATVTHDNGGRIIIRATGADQASATQNAEAALAYVSEFPALPEKIRVYYNSRAETLRERLAWIRSSIDAISRSSDIVSAEDLRGLFALQDELSSALTQLDDTLKAKTILVPGTEGRSGTSSARPVRSVVLSGAAVGLLLGLVLVALISLWVRKRNAKSTG